MKKLIILVLTIFIALNLSAQETVTNRSGKEVTVNNDATSNQKGSVKLTGDLGGTADAPTVPALSSKIDGTGAINFVPKFTGVKSLGNSLLYDNGTFLGLGTNSPGNKLEITQGTAGNSGLRFTNLNSSSAANTASSKVLGLNSDGDVILTNVPGTQNIVAFSTATPTNAGVVFTPNTPADQSIVYQSAVDNSLWTYNGTSYVTYIAPASTAWFTSGTTNDAGSSKTSNIYRTGNVGIGLNSPLNKLVVRGVNAATSANGTIQSNATFRVDGDTNHALDMGTLSATPFGSYVQSYNKASAGSLPLALNPSGGNVGIGNINPQNTLDVVGGVSVRNVSGAAGTGYGMEFMTSGNAPRIDWVSNGAYIGQFSSTTTDFWLRNSLNNTGNIRFMTSTGGSGQERLTILNNGNVGIGATTPSTTLQINNSLTATANVNANAQVLRLSRPTTTSIKWDNIAQFNLGSYSTAIAAQSRLDLALTNGLDATTLSNVMTWQANGNVGINNTAPSAPLVVQGATGTGALKLIAPSVAAGDNWWLGFGHGTTSTDANDRARIGVDVAGGGLGRLFFTTGASNTQVRAMYIDESQRVGIGTSTPTAQLEVASNNGLSAMIRRGGASTQTPANLILQKTSGADAATHGAVVAGDFVGRILFSASNGTSYPLNGTDIVGYAAGLQSASNNGGGILFRTVPQNSVTQSLERMRIDENGNVGVGTTTPVSRLEVNGAATNTTAFNAAAGTSIDFTRSNLAYTTASAGAFTLTGIKDGGSYTLSVQGATAGTASFTATGFTFRNVNNGVTTANRHTLYTFIVMGTNVYFYMVTGI
jgi:hypothetical protein